MPLYSVLQDGRLSLTQGYIYRARMLIKAPGFVATEGKVASALGQQGFSEVQFFDKNSLPADWPADQAADKSGAFSWTAFLQGKFGLTDRTIPLGDLPGTVEVLAMWSYLVPLQPAGPVATTTSVTIAPPPGPGPADLHLTVPPPAEPRVGVKLAASALGMLAAYCVVRMLTHR
jgi:hypothetical protein